MPDILATHAATLPGKVAVVDDRPGLPVVTYTYAELRARSNQLGRPVGRPRGDRATKVVWCGQNSAGLPVAVHAIRKVGAVGVPLNYHLSPSEAAYVVDNCDAQVVVVDAEYAELIEGARPTRPRSPDVLVFDGDGSLERRLDTYPTDDVEPRGDRRDHYDLHLGHDGPPQGGGPEHRPGRGTGRGLWSSSDSGPTTCT